MAADILAEHLQYLSDTRRMSAYSRAIAGMVKAGDTVVDLGCGSGIMGLIACRAGAKRVYCIEVGDIIEVAREVARSNGYAERLSFVRGLSTQVELPEKVDVLVADHIGSFGIDCNLWQCFEDARHRFLKPEGVTIPQKVDLRIAPVEAPELFKKLEFWDSSPEGLDFRSARTLASNTHYGVHFDTAAALGESLLLASLEMNRDCAGAVEGGGDVVVKRSGILHGLGGWFLVQLSPGVSMTNDFVRPERINRRQTYFPIDRAFPVQEGDIIRIGMQTRPDDFTVNWTVTVLDGRSDKQKAKSSHSTWNLMTLKRSQLKRANLDYMPKLTSQGMGCRTAIGLCDGEHSVADIEKQIFLQHHDVFHSRQDAAVFVSELLRQYSE